MFTPLNCFVSYQFLRILFWPPYLDSSLPQLTLVKGVRTDMLSERYIDFDRWSLIVYALVEAFSSVPLKATVDEERALPSI